MATPSFDLLLFGRQKLATAAGPSPTQKTLTKVRLRIVQQVFNNRRLVYRNRVAANRQNLLLSTIETDHRREQATQRLQRHRALTDLKQEKTLVDSCLTLLPSYQPIDLTEPKDFYRFGVRVHSAAPYGRSHTTTGRSNLARSTHENLSVRAKSASTTYRPLTTPLQTSSEEFYIDHEDTESDDGDDNEVIPISDSQLISDKQESNDRLTSGIPSSIASHQSSDLPFDNLNSTTSHHRITWPVQIKVFALQDEDEYRQQFLAWRADQRKTQQKRSSKQFHDLDLEKKYRESIRRRKEIDSFITPEIIEEHQLNDPVFAKRYRQLKLAIRAGKAPIYDPNDREVHVPMNKSKMERTRTALITAKQNRMKIFYENQQKINDDKLSKRVDGFLKRLSIFKQQSEEEV